MISEMYDLVGQHVFVRWRWWRVMAKINKAHHWRVEGLTTIGNENWIRIVHTDVFGYPDEGAFACWVRLRDVDWIAERCPAEMSGPLRTPNVISRIEPIPK